MQNEMPDILLVASREGSDVFECVTSETELVLGAQGDIRVKRLLHSLLRESVVIRMAQQK